MQHPKTTPVHDDKDGVMDIKKTNYRRCKDVSCQTHFTQSTGQVGGVHKDGVIAHLAESGHLGSILA